MQHQTLIVAPSATTTIHLVCQVIDFIVFSLCRSVNSAPGQCDMLRHACPQNLHVAERLRAIDVCKVSYRKQQLCMVVSSPFRTCLPLQHYSFLRGESLHTPPSEFDARGGTSHAMLFPDSRTIEQAWSFYTPFQSQLGNGMGHGQQAGLADAMSRVCLSLTNSLLTWKKCSGVPSATRNTSNIQWL